jgi:hypothetical protein
MLNFPWEAIASVDLEMQNSKLIEISAISSYWKSFVKMDSNKSQFFMA